MKNYYSKLEKFAEMELFAYDIFQETFKENGMKGVYSKVGKKFKYKQPYKIACESAAESWSCHECSYDWVNNLTYYLTGCSNISCFSYRNLQEARKRAKFKYETK